MRLKFTIGGIFLAILFAMLNVVGAQSPTIEWKAWNAQITAYSDSSQLSIAETQIIDVTDGQIHAGERDYSQPVDIQNVYLAFNGGSPVELSEGNGPGTYQLTNTSDGVLLDYQLPNTANAGDSFAVQINYTVASATSGLIDWFVVPLAHDFPVQSSTLTINFPDGQMPSTDFVRLSQGNAMVSTSGNSIIVQSQGVIPANQSFEVQLPYGAGVGEPGTSGNTTNPVQTVPVGTSTDSSGGLGSILPILCVIGAVLLLGGRSLLGGLLGGLGGSLLGGRSGGSSRNPTSSPFGGNSPTRGFRDSPNQNREIPPVQGDKRSGGGAQFK